MATLLQLEQALINADKSGNIEDAKMLANAIKDLRANQQPTLPELAKDVGASIGSGAAKGLSYLAGLPGDVDQLGRALLPKIGLGFMNTPFKELITGKDYGELPNLFPTSRQVMDFAEETAPVIKPLTQYGPTTNLGRYAQTGIEFATPGITGKTKAALKGSTKLGLGGGLLYQGVEDATGSSGVAAGVTIPSMLAAGLFMKPSTGARLAQDSLRKVKDAEVKAARNLEQTGQELGINLMPGEVFDNKNVRNLTRDVVASEKGSSIIYDAAKNRRESVISLANQQADLIAEAPASQRAVLESISDTVTSSIQKAKTYRRTEAQKAGYGVSNNQNLETSQVLQIIDKIDDAIKNTNNKINKAKLNVIKNELIKKRVKVKKQKKKQIIPETNINKLDSTFKIYRDAYRNSQTGKATDNFINPDLGTKLFTQSDDGILNLLNQELRTNTNYAKANDTFAKLSNEIVNVVEKNVQPLIQGGLTVTKIKSFIFDPSKSNVTDINKTFEILNKTNPEASIQLANVYFRNAMNQSFKMTKQGDDLTQGYKLIESIAGKGQNRKNFMAVIDNVAKAKGVNPQQLKVGFEKMINVLERTGRVANLNNPGFDGAGKASKSIFKDYAAFYTFNPRVRLATKWGEFKAGRAWEELANVFVQDNSVDALVALAKTNPKSKLATLRTVQIVDAVQGIQTPPLTKDEERQILAEESQQ